VATGGFADEYRLLRTPRDGHRIVMIHRRKTARSDTGALGRVIRASLCRAILGLNVRHDIDIEATIWNVSSLPGTSI
jgi:hypothetical protein